MKKEYTPDEIANIKANLMAAFGTDKIEVQVKLKSLFKDKPFDIHVDEHYYVHFPYDIDEFNKILGTSEGKGNLLKDLGIILNNDNKVFV